MVACTIPAQYRALREGGEYLREGADGSSDALGVAPYTTSVPIYYVSTKGNRPQRRRTRTERAVVQLRSRAARARCNFPRRGSGGTRFVLPIAIRERRPRRSWIERWESESE
eukprot:667656-Rhodomonas_salina.1